MWKREAQSFYHDFSICLKPRAAPAARPRRAPKVNLLLRTAKTQLLRSDAGTQLTDFSQILQILRTCFRCMTSFTLPSSVSYLGFLLWHLWMTRPLRARVITCAHVCTELTHALSRKVLSLTKPKGKIYKAKSFRHYITRQSVKEGEGCGRSKEVNTLELIGQRVRVRIAMLRF